ncbi:MAG: mitochondrial fission ELM1 family protein [Alphaproteobacteria bacterium]|nr:mitochondrial fission ELM1 family protein [Alphaproteobacteria bacterium]
MKKTIWVLLDDRMGSVGQAKGILQEISEDFEIVEKNIVYNRFAALPNFLRGRFFLFGVNKKLSDDLRGNPDIVLSTSRRTTPVALWLKRRSKNKIKIVQLMFSGRYGLSDIDLLIVPEHDKGKINSKNVFYIVGCPHRVNEKVLAEAKEKWQDTFSNLPKPLTAVLVGGAIKKKPFSSDNANRLADEILNIHRRVSGSILITTSRRTGEIAQNIIMEKIKDIPAYTFLWGEEKENPILGFYACADRIIATGDSVSMVCEACGSGKDVMIFEGKHWLTRKHLSFVRSLVDNGYAVRIGDIGAVDFVPQKRLQNSADVARKIEALV